MKPNAPGEWHSRDGRRIVAAYLSGRLCWRPCIAPDTFFGASQPIETLEGDDWLPAEPPMFPPLPPKPPLVLSKVVGDMQPDWRAIISPERYRNIRIGTSDSLHWLDVIPHPDNDPEAERLIEQAKNRQISI